MGEFVSSSKTLPTLNSGEWRGREGGGDGKIISSKEVVVSNQTLLPGEKFVSKVKLRPLPNSLFLTSTRRGEGREGREGWRVETCLK